MVSVTINTISSRRQVLIEAGSTVRDALSRAEVTFDGCLIYLGGAPTSLDTAVSDGDVISVVVAQKGANA